MILEILYPQKSHHTVYNIPTLTFITGVIYITTNMLMSNASHYANTASPLSPLVLDTKTTPIHDIIGNYHIKKLKVVELV